MVSPPSFKGLCVAWGLLLLLCTMVFDLMPGCIEGDEANQDPLKFVDVMPSVVHYRAHPSYINVSQPRGPQYAALFPQLAPLKVAPLDPEADTDVSPERRRQRRATLRRLRRDGLIRTSPVTRRDSNYSHTEYLWSPEPLVEDKYTVLINTFRGRDAQAAHLLRHYARCAKLDRVVLLWNDVGRALPTAIVDAVEQSHGKVAVALQRVPNLTNRFRPQPVVRTDVIFSTDEDIVYDCDLVDFGFDAAQKYPESVVGFAPRGVVPEDGTFKYHWGASYVAALYNTIWVTKGGFTRRALHELYHSNEEFAHVRREVDRRVTGEDILMSFTHLFFEGAVTRKPKAIFVPRHSYNNIATGKAASLGNTTSSHRPRISAMIRAVLEEHGRDLVVERTYTDLWCEPFTEDIDCDVIGFKQFFWELYPSRPWDSAPNSTSPYVQV